MEKDAAFELADALERAGFAAAEDGRTPINRYSPPPIALPLN